MKKPRHKLGRWVVLTVCAAGLAYLLTGPEGLFSLYRQHRELTGKVSEIKRLHVTIDSLNLEIRRLRSDTAYIEKIARERLGMAAKGERVYKFPQRKD